MLCPPEGLLITYSLMYRSAWLTVVFGPNDMAPLASPRFLKKKFQKLFRSVSLGPIGSAPIASCL